MWNIEQNNKTVSGQDLRVIATIKEIATYEAAGTCAYTFIELFRRELDGIPKSNNFSASVMYKAFTADEWGPRLEIWKLDARGDKKTLCAVISYTNNSQLDRLKTKALTLKNQLLNITL